MRRGRSRLGVLIRLARLEEDRALQTLGRARMAVDRTLMGLRTATDQLSGTLVGAVLESGQTMTAARLAVEACCGRALQRRADELQQRLVGEREVEEEARVAVVEAKRKVRALRRAADRRAAREKLLRRRVESRRLDEIQRGRGDLGEVG